MPSSHLLTRALNQSHPEPFGRYELLGRIAMGGMAEVFVARCGQIAGLQTLIALKRILPSHASEPRFVRLFQREASILLRLHHPGIARVIEVGREGESWFLAMELVQGETLAAITQRLVQRQRRWDPDVVALIGARVAEALHHAHELRDSERRALGIVHRDVSPQNVMIGFDGAVKLIDFGIARWELPSVDSRASAVRGKMQYVSPEQARAERLDGRADLFSLGAVLHEALSGGSVFGRASTPATLEAVCSAPATPLSGVPSALARVVSRCLEKRAEDRFATAAELAAALRDAIAPGRVFETETLGQLVGSLFPERQTRWRQIEEMAAHGLGFVDELVRFEGSGGFDGEFRGGATELSPQPQFEATPAREDEPELPALVLPDPPPRPPPGRPPSAADWGPPLAGGWPQRAVARLSGLRRVLVLAAVGLFTLGATLAVGPRLVGLWRPIDAATLELPIAWPPPRPAAVPAPVAPVEAAPVAPEAAVAIEPTSPPKAAKAPPKVAKATGKRPIAKTRTKAPKSTKRAATPRRAK